MNPLTVTSLTFTVVNAADSVVIGSVELDDTNRIATFTPTSNLTSNTTYTATLTTGVKDLAANALGSDYVWTFTTGATADATAPLVSSDDLTCRILK